MEFMSQSASRPQRSAYLQSKNPLGLDGMEFVEFTTPANDSTLEKIFLAFGMECVAKHRRKNAYLFKQNDVFFVLNKEPHSFAAQFAKLHGASIPAIAVRVDNATEAFQEAVKRGAKPFTQSDVGPMELSIPAIYGVGESLIYFVDRKGTDPLSIYDVDFVAIPKTERPKCTPKGLKSIDHLTNNVRKGSMNTWADYYQKIFNFAEIRYFDITGLETGLLSRAMKSPCGKFAIPINEPKQEKSQIQEYINEYKGEGVQHLALLTDDIIATVTELRKEGVEFLDIPDTYYEDIPKRGLKITEDMEALKANKIQVDGDANGYLLQIFTKNLMGPIFFEIIQRKGHGGFGEGNFKALFEAIERDQKARGVL